MTKGRLITRLTPAACEEIQTRMLEVCQKIAEDHGLVIEGAGWRGTDTGFSFEPVFRVSIPASDGTAFNLEKRQVRVLGRALRIGPFGLRTRVPHRKRTVPDHRHRSKAATLPDLR